MTEGLFEVEVYTPLGVLIYECIKIDEYAKFQISHILCQDEWYGK